MPIKEKEKKEYKFFVDNDGKYMGGFYGDAKGTDIELEKNNTRVPMPPFHQSQRWDGKKWSAPVLTYKEKRVKAYASISEQMDMLYWDKVNGTDTWVEHIKSVKEAFKPQEG